MNENYKIDQMLTVKDAANLAGVSERRIQALCKQGRLGEKFGGRYMIRTSQLTEFLASDRKAGRPRIRE